MRTPSRFLPFVVGLGLGIAATIYLPGYARPYLPEWALGTTVAVKGTVEAKQRKADVLLLTVATPEGVLLATFARKVDEISLLINEKDVIEFNLPKYMPFIDDPRILRVVKEQPAAPAPGPEAKPKEQAAKEGKAKRQERPTAAATMPSTTGPASVRK
jgi:hypothetical protein